MNTVSNSEEENSLIDCILKGESPKFQQLVESYQKRIYSTVHAMLGNRQDAEDVTQETFLTAFRKLDQFQHRSSFYTWLYRISFNLAIDLQRRGVRKNKIFSQSIAEITPPSVGQVSTRNTPDQLAISNETATQVRVALSKLDSDRRNIIVMRDIEGMEYSEIATMLGLPVGTVRSRLHRARLELKDILKAAGLGCESDSLLSDTSPATDAHRDAPADTEIQGRAM
ncbi:MAG: sigma-70 family RNA polymerase sigma factor [Pirellula sp.]